MNKFKLTRRALLNIREIYEYSLKNWGEAKAGEYIGNIYNDLNRIAGSINVGELRKNRSAPFLMYPSGRHYIVYEPYKGGILIITILHQSRNIENIMQEFGSVFAKEINTLKYEFAG